MPERARMTRFAIRFSTVIECDGIPAFGRMAQLTPPTVMRCRDSRCMALCTTARAVVQIDARLPIGDDMTLGTGAVVMG